MGKKVFQGGNYREIEVFAINRLERIFDRIEALVAGQIVVDFCNIIGNAPSGLKVKTVETANALKSALNSAVAKRQKKSKKIANYVFIFTIVEVAGSYKIIVNYNPCDPAIRK